MLTASSRASPRALALVGGVLPSVHARLLTLLASVPADEAFPDYAQLAFLARNHDHQQQQENLSSHALLTAEMAMAIHANETTARVKRTHREHYERRAQDLRRFIEDGVSLRELSREHNVPPCVLARLLLEAIGLRKDDVKAVLRDVCTELPRRAAQLPHAPHPEALERLALDIQGAVDHGGHGSPGADVARRAVGLAHEALLYERLRLLGVAFETEDDLRLREEEKTPDAKLATPLLLRWRDSRGRTVERFVHWVDSKASFCDHDSFQSACITQFDTYARRFGPGLAVHWFGYVSGVVEHHAAAGEHDTRRAASSVLVSDDFPPKGVELVQLEVDVQAHMRQCSKT